MAAKTSLETRAKINRMWIAGGCTYASLEREFGITSNTIRMIVDPAYAERRRSMINANRRRNPPPSALAKRRRQTPSMAKA